MAIVTPMSFDRASRVPVISLFSGAGGLDLGVEDAGGDISVCVEPDPASVATLEANAGLFPSAAVIAKPIEKVTTGVLLDSARLERGEAALVVGGPPCQPFSKSGYWLQDQRLGVDDPRASLLDRYLRVLRRARPAGFIMENVASLTHPSHRDLFERFLEGARRAGYATRVELVQAVEFGVPQTRARVFVLGAYGRVPPSPLRRTHWWRSGDENRRRLLPPETAGRWIAHLDKEELFEPEEVLRGRWLGLLHEIPPGWNYKWHTEWAGHPNPTFVTETKFWTFLLKLSPYRPSWTIQASPGPWTGPLHWNNRRLRVPELAALQSFPPAYRFTGSRRERVRQIGNAVPPLLASKVASSVLADILGHRPRRGRRLRYRLGDEHPLDEQFVRHRGPRW